MSGRINFFNNESSEKRHYEIDNDPETENPLIVIGQYAGDFDISLDKIIKEVTKQLED